MISHSSIFNLGDMNRMKSPAQPGAPALEKGLDLLEALASESRGLSQKQLADRVGRICSDFKAVQDCFAVSANRAALAGGAPMEPATQP